MYVRLFALAALALPALAHAQEQEEEASPSGRDITRPVLTLDLRTEVAREDDQDKLTVTLRHDHPVDLGGGWRVNLRVDLPVKIVDAEEEADTGTTIGLSNVLFQAIFIRELGEDQGFGFGTQVKLPSASDSRFGSTQWQLLPTAGYRWPAHGISKESFFQILTRYRFSLADGSGRATASELQFSPNLEIGLPGKAYFSIFPSTDIRYDFKTKSFFLPLNLEVGKKWGRLVTSLEGGVGLIEGNAAPYQWKVEARIGLRF
ncbi:hypothetical protein HZY97_15900 [Sphingomonas sp. R-74633]|uniref:hypothetical protein n=1 Tax=Sphingomonas sp. R-74633 TaxID=2751188 RepID=UPI0015D40B1E|nr:hypothetical protein [Sphingomonas sp. R-74633]NYT42256.1 hypothetical protein [Sphingomonas sp. R-74633]